MKDIYKPPFITFCNPGMFISKVKKFKIGFGKWITPTEEYLTFLIRIMGYQLVIRLYKTADDKND